MGHTKTCYEKALIEILSTIDIPEIIDENSCGKLLDTIHNSQKRAHSMALELIYGKNSKLKRMNKRNEWWNPMIGSLIRNRNLSQQRWKKSKKTFYWICWQILKKKCSNLIKKQKKMIKYKEKKRLVEKFLTDKTQFWKEIVNRRERSINIDISLEVLKKHYEENFNQINKSPKSIATEDKM